MASLVEGKGLEQSRLLLEFMQKQGLNIRPLLALIAEGEKQRTVRRFEESKDPQGVPWLPLKRPRPLRKYQKGKKRKTGGSDKPLMNTGVLVGSIQWRWHGKNAVGIGDLQVRSGVHYGIFHQEGRGVPKRAFLGVSPALINEMEELILAHFSI